jgi:hypothetical protein
MDPIHPIRPAAAQPTAVEAVRRVLRAGRDRKRDERPWREERRAPAPAPPPAEAGDQHLDVRA